MSDYVYAVKMDRNGCPECNGENANSTKKRFKCEDCGFAFP